jgi:predicted transcriptional regulator
MNDLEIEIGRTLGASCFFIYHTMKQSSSFTLNEIMTETALSKNGAENCVKKLLDTNVLKRHRPAFGSVRQFIYKVNNEKQTWKFH